MPVLCSPANRNSADSTLALTGLFTRQHASTSSMGFFRRWLLTLFVLIAAMCFTVSAHATTWTVTDTSDNVTDTGSLRYAMTNAVSGDTIVFSSYFNSPRTITLGSTLPSINIGGGSTHNLSIVGPGVNLLTIDAGNNEAFHILSGELALSGVTIMHGAPAIYNQDWADVGSCTFTANSYSAGSAIFSAGNVLILQDSTFSDNIATVSGGAIEVNIGSATITNNTFYQNQATGGSGVGGAIYISGGASGNVINNTFVGNSAALGSAIHSSTGIIMYVDNNIFYNNTATTTGTIDAVVTGINTSDHNLYFQNTAPADANSCGSCTVETNVVSSDPKLLPFGFYGGDTESFAILPGSGAVCHGSASEAGILADQRGYAVDPTCASGYVDIGSIQTNQFQVTNLNNSGAGSLRAAMTAANTAGLGDITFATSLSGGTITLSASPLQKFDNGPNQINILGLGANNLTVSGNNDGGVGSVFYIDQQAVTFIYGLTISGGTSFYDGGQTGYGGGIFTAGKLTLSHTAITNNDANPSIGHPSIAQPYSYGGGIFMNSGSLTIADSTISGNASDASYTTGGGTADTGRGGGISLSSTPGASLILINSTISGNTANWWGGGMDAEGITVNMYNTTISNNQAALDAGGVYHGGGVLALYNSILDGNLSTITNVNNDLHQASGSYSHANSLVGTGTSTLAALANYGGPTQTMLPLPGSAAICTGSTTDIYLGTTTDQRGYPSENTTYTGYSTASPCVDMGAVQTNYSLAFVQQPTNTGVGSAITPSPTVALYDNGSNAVNGAAIPITLAIGSGTLGGTLTETTTGGVATFSGLTVDTPGTGDELGVTVTVSPSGASNVITLVQDSSAFDVTGAFSKFAVQANSPQQAGVPFSFTVTAEDSGGSTVTNYTGTVHFTSSDVLATLPANYTFLPGDNGVHVFNATLKTAGTQTITATDTGDSNTGTSNNITVNAAAAASFTVTGYPSPVYQNTTHTGTVTAYDAYNNVATGYAGPATISSSTDVTATITQPSSWSNGAATFTVAFDHTGSQIITASQTGISSGSEIGIVVNAAPSFVVTTASDDASGVAAHCPSPSNCSLRDALAASSAAGAGNITFDPTVFATPQTITLALSGLALDIPQYTSITGATSGSGLSLKNLVTMDGSDIIGALFAVFPGTSGTSISNLNIVNGHVGSAGGCIFNQGTLTVNNSTISNCSSGFYGGGIFNGSTLTLNNSTVSGNIASNSGGGVYNDTGGTFTINNSTINGNSSPDGGGIYNLDTLIVNDTTISANSATSGHGGGIYNGGTETIANSIVSGNTAPSNPTSADSYNTATLNNSGGNLVGGSVNLAPLGNYGGPTQTMVALPGSPAICGGLSVNVPAGITTDQRGNPRASTDCPSGTVDSGATQSEYSLSFTTSPGSNQLVNMALTPTPVVSLYDNGNLIQLNGVSITLSAHAGTLNGTTTQSTTSGAASFSGLTIPTAQASDYLVATAPLYGSNTITANSSNFNVVAITITPSTLPSATVGVAYSQSITASNGTAPYTYTKTAGAFPAGLTLNSSTGLFSGTPTAGGSFGFTITATDSTSATASQAYTLTVNSATITISPATLPNGTYGTAYSQGITAMNGTAPYTYQVTAGSLPTGLTLNPNSGVLSGTPTVVNTFNFTIKATDSSTGTGPYTGTRAYTVTIGKATATIHVTPYNVNYDGNPHTATATATGYQGVNLISEMNLSGTTHTQPGTYTNDTWTFTDTTGNYLNASGTITDVINKLSQTITFTPPFPITGYTNNATFLLKATATSGLTVSFSSTTPSVCAVTTFGTPAVPAAKVLSAGNCIIQATQAGNSIYSAATPVLHTYTIVAALTNTTLSASSTSVKSGASVTFTATVTSFVSASLTGTVSFYNGGTLLGTVSLSNGKAVLTTSALTVGSHSITADYNGATDFQSSNSAAVTITVTP